MDEKIFSVLLSKGKVEQQPELDADAPVSRLYEQKWHEKYEYPYYYDAGTYFPWGFGLIPAALFDKNRKDIELGEPREVSDDHHLRSLEEVRLYSVIAGRDEVIGTVEDMVVDDETWTVRYIIIDTGTWLEKRPILLAPAWCQMIDWTSKSIRFDVPTDKVKAAPVFTMDTAIERSYEQALHDFYGKPAYWSVPGA
ncbi:PRC-barrel domain-containing protein [Pontiellaceae bacterium B1224]|nr:PRC-barrel domain-containing protein [Pontiellaceae bacterium B1224]